MRKNLYFLKPFIVLAVGLLVGVFTFNYFCYFPYSLYSFWFVVILVSALGSALCIISFDIIDYLMW